MTNPTKTPIDHVNDGGIRASIWGNEAQEGGVRYSVTVTRSFRDESGAWRETNSYSNGELLRLARVCQKAYDRVLELRAADRSEREPVAE